MTLSPGECYMNYEQMCAHGTISYEVCHFANFFSHLSYEVEGGSICHIPWASMGNHGEIKDLHIVLAYCLSCPVVLYTTKNHHC